MGMKIYGRCMSAWIKVKIKTRNKDNNIRLTLTVIYGRCMSAWIKVKIKTSNKDNNIRLTLTVILVTAKQLDS